MKILKYLKLHIFVLSIAYCILSIFGCGYTTRSMISNKFKTIYIAQFANKIDITKEGDAQAKYRIYKPLLEINVTKSVINRFLFDGNLKPVKQETADLKLKGEVVDFRRDPLRYTSSDEVEEYRVSIVVNLKLWNTKENKLEWEENGFIGDATYFTQGTNVKSESTAITDAINDLSRRIVERAVEQW